METKAPDNPFPAAAGKLSMPFGLAIRTDTVGPQAISNSCKGKTVGMNRTRTWLWPRRGAPHLALGLGQRLALLRHDRRRQLIGVGQDLLGECLQQPGTGARRLAASVAPLVGLFAYTDPQAAIRAADDIEFGLQAGLFTNDWNLI